MEQALRTLLADGGAHLVGFADITELDAAVNRGFPRAVSIGIALPAPVVARIPTGPHRDYRQAYDSINAQLDALATLAEGWLTEKGHSAWAATCDRLPTFEETCESPLPHKTTARLAGHGWIGKNAALINPQYGSAVRYTSVLTGAPLQAGLPVGASRCGNCAACRQACGAGAVLGPEYAPGMPREEIFDFARCQATLDSHETHLCGLCLAACPYTMAYVRRAGLIMEKSL